ncbi:MAG: hypothetical protein ACYCRD_07130 [Leptospirillum sp.]
MDLQNELPPAGKKMSPEVEARVRSSSVIGLADRKVLAGDESFYARVHQALDSRAAADFDVGSLAPGLTVHRQQDLMNDLIERGVVHFTRVQIPGGIPRWRIGRGPNYLEWSGGARA